MKCLLVLLLFPTSALFAQKERKFNDSIIDIIKPFIREGDVVFRNGVSKESLLIRTFAVGVGAFSHCGIVVKDRSGLLRVMHVLGGGKNTKSDLYAESFDDFVTDSANTAFGIARYLLSESDLQRLRSYVDSLLTIDIRFDYEFALDSGEKLYCTELVARCLEYSTKDRIFIQKYTRDLSAHPTRFLLNRKQLVYYPIEYLQYNEHVSTFLFFNFKLQGNSEREAKQLIYLNPGR
jgi:hypothetical protein